jgi:RHS repeat-associated protein
MNPPPLRIAAGLRLLALLLLLLTGGGLLAHAAVSERTPPPAAPPGDTITIFGPRVLAGSTAGAYHVERFSVAPSASAVYELRVVNGDGAGAGRVAGLSLRIDGSQVLGTEDVAGAGEVVRRVALAAGTATLEATVTGPATSSVTVSIRQMPDPTFEVLAPHRFYRSRGAPAPEVYRFTLPPSAGTPFHLHIRNGNPDGTQRVSSATVLLNGARVVRQNQLNQQVAGLIVEVPPRQENVLEVEVASPPGSFLEIFGRATDVLPPELQISAPVPGLVTRDTEVDAAGRVLDVTATRVTVNGVLAARTGEAFTARVPLAQEGENTLHYVAVDAAGLRTDSIRTVIRDTEPPVITLTAPAAGTLTADTSVVVTGRITDRTAVTANVNGIPLVLGSDGSFSQTVPLAEGANFLTVAATDVVGNGSTRTLALTSDRTAPVVAFTAPAEGHLTNRTEVAVAGTVQDASPVASVQVNGVAMAVADGAFSGTVPLPAEGANTLTATATDAAGNSGTGARSVIRDTEAPVVAFTAPAEGALTNQSAIAVAGTVQDASPVASVHVSGVVMAVADGAFSGTVPLSAEGTNTLTATATDAAGNSGTGARSVIRDTQAPAVAITAPAEGHVTKESTVAVTGTVADASATTVTVNGVSMTVDGGTFSGTVPLPVEGTQALTATATDEAGNTGTDTRSVVRDTQAPVVTVLTPVDGTLTRATLLMVTGTVLDGTAVTLTVAGAATPVDAAGAFAAEVALSSEGANAIALVATDAAGNQSAPVVAVVRDTEAPVITWTAPEDGSTTPDESVTVAGTITDASPVTATLNGGALALGGDGAFSVTSALVEGANAFAITATDAAGNAASAARTVTREQPSSLPPDPARVAPALDRGVATTVGAATEFLYTGQNPIQTGVSPGTIDVVRAAGLRGRVVDRALQPLGGVTVTVRGHPEYGQTLTRADGWYDLVVNGGGSVRLDFDRASYLPAQRQTDAPWQDWVVLDDVILLQLDPIATPVALNSAEAQVVRASVVEDADGPRQATLVIPAGTTATIQLPDGTTVPAENLTIRATEYTVGENGPAAMPGILPATSAYTYAAQVSVDGIPPGADVVFSTPVPFYVENFLDFPVGTPVPTGTWDPARGVWVPTTDGRVIAVVATAGGVAEIDVTGDGVPDGDAVLAPLGITPQERQRLAATYAPGTKLQRTPIWRTSGIDLNYPAGILGTDPQGAAASECDPASGLAALCTAQASAQRVALPGTDYDMSYTSARAAGNTASRALEIDLTGATLPADLRRVEVEVTVAGRTFRESLEPTPNLRHTFTWDGKDAYGRPVQGVQSATVRIGHTFPFLYNVPTDAARSFGLSCTGSGGGYRQACAIPADVDSRARQEGTRWQTLTAAVGAYDAGGQAMGGWTLGVHHAYDPAARLLHRGDGTTRGGTPALKAALRTAGGNGTSGFAGDGGLATEARLFGMADMRSAPTGELYVADFGNHRVRRIGRDGVITTVAGGGTGGDGGPALGARLQFPHGVWIARDGGLLIAEEGGQRIRRVDPDGTIRTLAGTGTAGYTGDGGPATEARISTPRYVVEAPDGSIYFSQKSSHVVRRIMTDGTIVTVAGTGTAGFGGDGGTAARALLNQPDGIAIGPDGSLYVADQLNNRVRRVAPSGQITTVAGTGVAGFLGDGGQATAARLNRPQGLEVGRDGSLYIADSNNNRVRRVAPSGVITTAAGTGTAGTSPEGGAATESRLRMPRGVALGPDGGLYVADFGNHRVRRIAPAFPGFSGDETGVAGEDGREIYVFDAAGRHLRTQTATTGDTIHLFGYDAAGRLATVTDGDGRVTTLERDAAGRMLAVTGPDGVRTAMEVGADGTLGSLTLPGGATVHYNYEPGGLLAGRTDPNGHTTHYDYDAQGRLTGERRPDGGSLAMSRTRGPNGPEVTWSTGGGVGATFRHQALAGGGRQSTVVLPTGQGVVTTHTPDGRTISTAPDGTSTTVLNRPDPLHGMQSPLAETVTRMPSGLEVRERTGRAVVVDPFNNSVLRQTDSLFVNSRLTLDVYDRSSGVATRTMTSGRQASTLLDAQGRVLETRIPGMETVVNAYDGDGRLSTVTQGNRVRSYTYDGEGRLQSATDALGRTEYYTYDAHGRLAGHMLRDRRVVQYGYDAAGNLTSITPPARPAHRFGFTETNQTETYTAPDAGQGAPTTTLSYGLDGQLTHVQRPDGSFIATAYDAAGRRRSVTLPGDTVTYTYNAQTGRLATARGPGGVTLGYTWDGGLLTRVQWSGPVAGTLDIRYDTELRVAAHKLNGADSVGYRFDADGLLVGAGLLNITRGAQVGLPLGTTLGGITTSQAYNRYGDRVRLDATFGADTLFRAAYETDAAGRITGVAERIGADTRTWAFAYDSAGRLAAVTRDGAAYRAYEYDANGNRVREVTPAGVVTGTVDVQDRLRTWGDAAYGYTAAGDLATRAVGADTTRYRYDAQGNLREVRLPDGRRVEYLVDAENRRAGVRVDGAHTQSFVWLDDLRVAAELDGAGRVVSRFVYDEGANVPAYMARGGRTYRLVSDHLGSVRLVVDAQTGQVAQRIDYDPYGRVLADDNPGFQPFGYAGGLADHRTGLVRFGARDYDPAAGRWTARDPILFDGGDANLYGYVLQDPVNGTDPRGLVFLADHAGAMNVQGFLSASRASQGAMVRKIAQQLVKRAACYAFEEIATDIAMDVLLSNVVYVGELGANDVHGRGGTTYGGRTERALAERMRGHERNLIKLFDIILPGQGVRIEDVEATVVNRLAELSGHDNRTARRGGHIGNIRRPGGGNILPLCKDP